MLRLVPGFLLLLAIVTPSYGAAVELSFIDHFNLRKVTDYDQKQLANHVSEIKHNLDKAKTYGVGTYILFSRSFERLVDYDFKVDELGDLTGIVYSKDSSQRKDEVVYAKCFNEVLDYADGLGIKVIFHTNQFEFPKSLYELAGQKLSGTAAVCPGKPLAFELLVGKLQEFFGRYPKCAGIELTLSETQAKITECKYPACKDMSDEARFVKVADAAIRACKPLGKTVMIRTWGNFEQSGIVNRLPKSIICSTKFTLPDFCLTNDPNPVMGLNADRQEVEYDGWGEYSGWNFFPCYYGDIFSERIKICQRKGVGRMAVRLNWEPGVNHIFDKPYGNEVNILLFANLAADPNASADDLLRQYVAKVYAPSAREAAFRLYKRSVDLQTVWLTWRGKNANDHSRVYIGGINRVRRQIGDVIPQGYDAACAALDERRGNIDKAYEEALSLVVALGPDVASEWKHDLERYARAQWFMARANSDCIQLFAAYREVEAKRPLPSLNALADDIARRSRLWRMTDLEMFNIMHGEQTQAMLEEVRKQSSAQ